MSDSLKKGSKVTWQWAGNEAHGKVVEVFHEDVTRRIKGKDITRKASTNEPAYLIEQSDGDRVLKSKSELV